MAVQADWMEKDLYAVLGVTEDADGKAISRAYRKLARQLHPDTHPDDAAAAERFKEVTAAYDVIGDPVKRGEYDEFRRAIAGERWNHTQAPRTQHRGNDDGQEFFAFEDLFFGAIPRAGADIEAVLTISFEDAVRGLTTEVAVDGARPFKVRVPAGVEDGQRIRLAGKGRPGRNGGPPGDLYAVVRVGEHPVFGRRGRDLTIDISVTWPEAVLGTEVDVPTLDGAPVRLRVPPGTPHGRTLRVRGRGGTGDLLVTVHVTVPTELTGEQRAAVEAVANAFETPRVAA